MRIETAKRQTFKNELTQLDMIAKMGDFQQVAGDWTRELMRDAITTALKEKEFLSGDTFEAIVSVSIVTRQSKFGKPKSWFSQKLNNHQINGTPAKFSPAEIETLKNALYTISIEIQELADEL